MDDKLIAVRNELLNWRQDLMSSEYASRALTIKNYEGLVVLGRLCAYRDALKLINTTLRNSLRGKINGNTL